MAADSEASFQPELLSMAATECGDEVVYGQFSQRCLGAPKGNQPDVLYPISNLPPGLQEAVAAAYLCMRAIDQIEDAPDLEVAVKTKLLRAISLNLPSTGGLKQPEDHSYAATYAFICSLEQLGAAKADCLSSPDLNPFYMPMADGSVLIYNYKSTQETYHIGGAAVAVPPWCCLRVNLS